MAKGKDWRRRGAGRDGGQQADSKRWQKQPGEYRKPSRVATLRVKLGFLSILFVTLLCWWVWVWWEPPPTYVITAVATKYKFPIPPNPWAAHDVKRFETLTNTLTLSDISDEFNQKSALGRFESELKAAVARQDGFLTRLRYDRRLVIYVSAFGAVNDQGEACLITSDMSVRLDGSEWLRVEDLLELINQEVPRDIDVFLALDASQLDSLLHLGVIYNSFTERLIETVDAAQHPRLTVLNSTSCGEVSWASPELEASVFGFFLFHGIAGAADRDGENNVTTRELVQYVQREVANWVDFNRRDAQHPLVLWPRSANRESLLKTKLALSHGKAIGATPIKIGGATDQTQLLASFNGVWERHGKLADKRPYLSYPVIWQQLEQRLVWVEKLALGGYGSEVNDEIKRVVSHLSQLDNLMKKPNGWIAETSLALVELSSKSQASEPQAVPSLKGFLEEGVPLGNFLESVSNQTNLVEFHLLHLIQQYANSPVDDNRGRVIRCLELMKRAESLAASPSDAGDRSDPRIHYGLSHVMARADSSRRKSENLFFVGTDEALNKSDKVSAEATALYDEVEAMSDALRQSLAMRDRVWAELPYLSEWLTMRRPQGQKEQEHLCDKLINTTVYDLTSRTNKLANLIDMALKTISLDAGDTPDELSGLAQTIGNGLLNVRKEFDRDVKAGTQDQLHLRRVAGVLQTPLVRGENRKRLHEVTAQLRLQFASSYRENLAESQRDNASERKIKQPLTNYLKRVVSWKTHPAIRLVASGLAKVQTSPPTVGAEVTLSDALTHVEAANSQLRQLINSARIDVITTPVYERRNASLRLIENAENEVYPIEIRHADKGEFALNGLNAADRMIRSSAVVVGYDKTTLPIPSRELLNLDRHFFNVWLANRCIDDYWGPRVGSTSPSSFFVTAAQKHLRSADQFDTYSSRQTTTLLQLLDQEDAIVIESDAIVSIDDQQRRFGHDVRVTLAPGSPDPDGIFRITLSSKGQIVSLSKRDEKQEGSAIQDRIPRVRAKVRKAELSLIIDPTTLSDPIEFRALFRGHLATSSPHVATPDYVSEMKYQAFERATLSVTHDTTRKGAIVLILDASGSMNEPWTNPEGGSGKKWDIATSALKTILNLVGKTQAFHVGFWIYGHELGYRDGKPVKRVGRDENGDPRLEPYSGPQAPEENVSALQHIDVSNVFTKSTATDLMKKVEGFGPTGVTPLYRSIKDVMINDFTGIRSDAERHIIVLTDGANNQTGFEKATLLEEISDLHQNMPFKLDIINMSVPEKDEMDDDFALFLRFVEHATGGKVYKPNGGESLVRDLKASIGLGDYYVEGPSFPTPMGKRQEIGRQVELTRPGRYQVRTEYRGEIQITSVVIEGGENILLRTNGKRLYFDTGGQDKARIIKVKQPEGAVSVRIYWPEPKDDDIEFEFAIEQKEETEFMSRPLEAWLQITALDSQRKRDRVYHFYDMWFRPGQQVPVMKVSADNWPKHCPSALVQTWIGVSKGSNPKCVLRISDVLDDPRLMSKLSINGARFSEVQLRGRRLTLIERRQDSLRQAPPARVRILTSEGKSASVSVARRVYEADNTIGHVFDFDSNVPKEQIMQCKIEITTHESIAKDSITLPEAVLLEGIR